MPHFLSPAPTGRARCRGCSQPIARGELRFGESIPNPFAEGETTLWFHLGCAAFKRPEPFLETLLAAPPDGDAVLDREALERTARASLAHRRLPRIDGAERSPSGQAKCRSCHEAIARGSWRIRLAFFEQGLFSAGGFLHLDCRTSYFEGHPVRDALLCFSTGLDGEERAELLRALDAPAPGP